MYTCCCHFEAIFPLMSLCPLLIEDLVEAHPKLFLNKQPQISPTVPCGWRELVEWFCLMLEKICNEHELTTFQFIGILEESGFLILDFDFDCELSVHQTEMIESKVLLLRNRSFFTCYVCGRLVDTLDKPVLCEKHNKIG